MRSWTDQGADLTRATWPDAVQDLGHLLRFRAATVRRRLAGAIGVLVVLGLTFRLATAPARLTRDGDTQLGKLFDELARGLEGNLGVAFVAVLLLGMAASMGGGGGRELLSRTEATLHPVIPVTEHLGALVLTPLNLAWLVQVWGLLASWRAHAGRGTVSCSCGWAQARSASSSSACTSPGGCVFWSTRFPRPGSWTRCGPTAGPGRRSCWSLPAWSRCGSAGGR